jgi:hypothetical protein
MIDPRKQILIMNLVLAGLLLAYTAEYVARFTYALVVAIGQSF